jgi:transcriptional regulator with XRE-family HTH domain
MNGLLKALERRKISQAQLARMLDVERATVTRYVKPGGDSRLTLVKLRQIAAKIDATVAELADEAPPATPRETELLALFRALTPDNQAAVLRILKQMAPNPPAPNTLHEPPQKFLFPKR